MHEPPQNELPGGQSPPPPPPVQTPLTHVLPLAQTTPHPPQLAASLDRLTHDVPHFVRPEAHSLPPAVHVPAIQNGVAPPQTTPQPPQLLMSLLASIQVPLQQVRPLALQLLPMAPQLGSDEVSTQV